MVPLSASVLILWAAAAAAPRPKNKNEHVRSDPPTHHDIVKQYRKGLTAVVDRCVYLSYNRYHSVPKSFICCCSGRDSCMLTSRCMLRWLRSAPYPALCPCEPLRPVGDMQAVSYGARSRQYSPLLPASSSQPRSIVQRPRSGPMCRVHIYTATPRPKNKNEHALCCNL